MYLYENTSGVTAHCLGALRRVLPCLGRVREVRGEVSFDDETVVVEGTHGEAYFSGFRWGYSGEGSRGTAELLLKLGLPEDVARRTAFKTPVGECWHFKF